MPKVGELLKFLEGKDPESEVRFETKTDVTMRVLPPEEKATEPDVESDEAAVAPEKAE